MLRNQARPDGEPIRVAIVGTGNIARIHAGALAAVGSSPTQRPGTAGPQTARGPGTAAQATIVAAADIEESRLAAFRSEFGIPATYCDLGELLQQARPDLVHLCTPPWLHHEQALTCLRAGVSVLTEKPPTISLREFDELVAAGGSPVAEGSPVPTTAHDGAQGPPWFATVFQHRFGSGQRRLKALAAGGTLGRPLAAVCHTLWFRDQAYFDVDWRGRWDTEGGGPTMGHGIHQMDMLTDVLGDWTEVSALARQQARSMRTEDLSVAQVTFANGAAASIVNSVLSPREESYLRFDFERATVELTHLYGYGDDDWRITPAPGYEQDLLTAWKDAYGGGVRSGHAAQFREVLACLHAQRRPPVAPADSRRTLSLAAAIYASAFNRRPVTPADLAPGMPFYGDMNGGTYGW